MKRSDKPKSEASLNGAGDLPRATAGTKEGMAVPGERLKVTIEEQKSANARLKEKLRSVNEELIASTKELVRGNRVLSHVSNDLSNFLANVNIPIVLLGPDLAIHRCTPAAKKALHLSSNMVGRSIADIKLPLRVPSLKQLLLNVVETGHAQTLEVPDAQGRWYYLVLRPYRTEKRGTEKSKTAGAVMALIDIHDRKLSEKNVLRLAASALDSNDAVIICDLKGRILAWNKGAQKMYGYGEAEALRMSIKRLMPGNKRVEARDLSRASAAPIETQRRAKNGLTLDVLLTVTVLRDDKGRPVEVATTERDITERKRAERELRGLHARVISAQDTERKRLARELHDGVGQILAGAKFSLESLPRQIALSEEGAAQIHKVGGFLNRAISEIRRVSQNLMPAELMGLGLEPALRALFREFKGRAGIHATLRTGRILADIAPELSLALFRIAQEALNNVGKHSKATRVAAALSREGDEIVLRMSDNGVGFNLDGDRPPIGRGIGLGSMRERAESVGGSIALHSTPQAGTTIIVRAPLPRLEEDAA